MSVALASMLGMTFDAALKGTAYDPSRGHSLAARAFHGTLNGPQEPAKRVRLDGHTLLVFETCMANLCASYHSVIAFDLKSRQEYAVTYGDHAPKVLIPASFGPAVDQSCGQQSCDFKVTSKPSAARGQAIMGEPISQAEIAKLDSGASCTVRNTRGQIVLFTAGVGLMRYHGQLRKLHEDGIGGPDIYTNDGWDKAHPPLHIEIAPRSGPTQTGAEKSIRPIYLNIMESGWVTITGTMDCES